MRRTWTKLSFFLASLSALVAACSAAQNGDAEKPPVVDLGNEGGTPEKDDGSVADTGRPTADDAGDAAAACAPSGDILGTLVSGTCCTLKQKLLAKTPSLDSNVLVFTAGETYDRAALSPGGQTLYDAPNAGGSSGESEAISFEVLRYCEGATLLKTETEVLYQPPDDSGPNTITDILVSIDGKKVGVSVTRAYKPPTQTLTDADVEDLLVRKLEGIKRSSERVLPADKWVKQILHVFSVNKAATEAVARVWSALPPSVKADTIVLVTETAGGGFLYCNPDPPLGTECK